MPVSQVQPPQQSITLSSQFQYVSIDELTQFCEIQLQGCDTTIRSLTSNQQEINTNAQNIAAAQSALNDLAADVGKGSNNKLDKGSDANDCAQDATAFGQLQDTIAKLKDLASSSTDPAASAITAEVAKLQGYIDGSDKNDPKMGQDLNPDDVTDMSKDLQSTADGLSTDQTMGMMKVQSAVSQREQMVQLVTGMIEKFDEMTSSVVANIGK